MPRQHTTQDADKLYAKGQEFFKRQDYKQALKAFYSAWLALPKPKDEQESAATVLMAIGNTYFSMRKYNLAVEALRSALACHGTGGQGMMCLRLGQSLMMLGDEGKAMTFLNRAFSLGGEKLFEGENPKYLYVVKKYVVKKHEVKKHGAQNHAGTQSQTNSSPLFHTAATP